MWCSSVLTHRAAVARQLDVCKGFQLVGAVDIDPAKVGSDAGDVLELGRRLRVRVGDRMGVNPGFVWDALPIALTAVCERVDPIEVQRVQEARMRRLPFQRKIGAGLT